MQVGVPLRHLAIPGDVRWTDEGGRFAWRVMAEGKVGWATFVVRAPAGQPVRVPISQLLTPSQAHAAAVRPELLHQVADVLADRATLDGQRASVHVDAVVTWNGRPAAPLVDPDVDLAAVPLRQGGQRWLLPPPQ